MQHDRPSRRREVNNEIDFGEIRCEYVDWFELAQVSVQ
jgi:hypothetical protein